MGSAIRLLGLLACGVVLLAFGLFAVDEMERGSQNQQDALASELSTDADPAPIVPGPREEVLRERRNSELRELIDDTGDILLLPFAGVVDSDNVWVEHGVPTLLALVLYGLLFGLVANLLPKRRDHQRNWRTAEP